VNPTEIDRLATRDRWLERALIANFVIHLGIPLEACAPLTGSVRSRAASAIAGAAVRLCFTVPRVAFRFSTEAHDRRPSGGEVTPGRT
jgi:hypothetical protein